VRTTSICRAGRTAHPQAEVKRRHDIARVVKPHKMGQHRALIEIAHEAEILLVKLLPSHLPCNLGLGLEQAV